MRKNKKLASKSAATNLGFTLFISLFLSFFLPLPRNVLRPLERWESYATKRWKELRTAVDGECWRMLPDARWETSNKKTMTSKNMCAWLWRVICVYGYTFESERMHKHTFATGANGRIPESRSSACETKQTSTGEQPIDWVRWCKQPSSIDRIESVHECSESGATHAISDRGRPIVMATNFGDYKYDSVRTKNNNQDARRWSTIKQHTFLIGMICSSN